MTEITLGRPHVDLMPFVKTVQLQHASADGHVQLMDVETGLIVYITPADDMGRAQARAMRWARRHRLALIWQ